MTYKILFQGDSITNAFRKPEEINNAFQLGAGYVQKIASFYQHDYPEWKLEFLNRGVSGNKISDLRLRWVADTVCLYPDLISILCGINDSESDVKDYDREYRELIEYTFQALPQVKIVLMEPFLLSSHHRMGKEFLKWKQNVMLYQQAVQKICEDYQLLFIPMQSCFDHACQKASPAHWIYDGIHPTAAGFEVMSRQWIKIVDPYLRTCLGK